MAVAEHRVDAGFGLERTSGPLVGAEGTMQFGSRWDVSGYFLGGTLGARTAGALERDIGEVSLSAGRRIAPWLIARASITRRMHHTTLARQGWLLAGVGAEGRPSIGRGAVHGIVRLTYLPVVSVRGLEAPTLAFAAATGMEYRRGPASLSLLYTLERYDFPPQRLEQMSAVVLRAALRLGRR